MNVNGLNIVIRPAEESELDVIWNAFSPDDMAKPEYRRHEVQKRGEGAYLIAWHKNTPIGAFLVRWSGPNEDPVTRFVDITCRAYLEGGLTLYEYQGRGVATAIIKEAERLAIERGCTHIGLAVGSTDNPRARRLYEKLGYVDWGHGEYTISWDVIDANGSKRIDSEVVTYLQKRLQAF